MSEVKDVIVQGLWKITPPRSAVRYVSSAGGHPRPPPTPSGWVGHHPVLTLTNLTIFQPAPLDAGGDPDPIYVMIIASVVSVVQMLINAYAFRPLSVAGDFHPAYRDQLHRGRPRRSLAAKGPALSALDGFSIGMALPPMFVLAPARDPWQRHPV